MTTHRPAIDAIRAAALGPAMTEAELMLGLTEALTIAGWRWTHIRRSDGVTVGDVGLPDIIAVHHDRDIALAWECKGRTGVVTLDQAGWIAGLRDRRVDARVVRPADYDEALRTILAPRR